MEAATYDGILDRLRAQAYDLSLLVKTPQLPATG